MFYLDPVTRKVVIAVNPALVDTCRQQLEDGRIRMRNVVYRTRTEGTTALDWCGCEPRRMT